MKKISNALLYTCIILLLSTNIAYADTIRKPSSFQAKRVTNMALALCCTRWPDEHLHDNGDHWQKIENPESQLEFYYRIFDGYLTNKGANAAYSSCTQYIATAIASTYDAGIGLHCDNSEEFYYYCISNPAYYRCLGNIPFSELHDGDLIVSLHHTAIYVGDIVEGPGNVAEAGYTSHTYPGIDCWYMFGRRTLGEIYPWKDYLIFRIES